MILREIIKKFNERVSAEGIFDLHSHVLRLEKRTQRKFEMIAKSLKKAEQANADFQRVRMESKQLKSQGESVDKRCMNLEYQLLKVERQLNE
mmetsp:Transcript_25599/g.39380  ORF Transcript_25599/g.39380 Transcript_25599/m.39380 type:complete len:92 (-) Transcript_25599:18-293(-)